MWLVFGISAIILTTLNIISVILHKKIKWLGFLALSLTALTLCAFLDLNAQLIIKEDWSAIADILPTLSKITWVLTSISIIINGICLWKANK